ncbi:hypothetical protein WMF28_25700 [Sorangium sp. So ce590]
MSRPRPRLRPAHERAYELAAQASAAPGPGGGPLHLAIDVREVACRASRWNWKKTRPISSCTASPAGCGDGVCSTGESTSSCPADCQLEVLYDEHTPQPNWVTPGIQVRNAGPAN